MSTASYAAWLARDYPHRLPNEKDFSAAISTVLKRSKLDGDPLSAVAVICKRHPVAIIAFVFPDLVNEANNTKTEKLIPFAQTMDQQSTA